MNKRQYLAGRDMCDNDGFTLVKYKKPKNIKPSHKDKIFADSMFYTTQDDEIETDKEVDTIMEKIASCKLELRSSMFYKDLIKSIFENISVIDQEEPVGKFSEFFTDFVCYSIGKISESRQAMYQFALLVLLWEQFKPPGACYIYDPVFTGVDKAILGNFEMVLISQNEEAKRNVSQKTLFFVPHGGKPLYNNILWSNWSPALTNVVLLGNSFHSYDERIPSEKLHAEAAYIAWVLPLTLEMKFPTKFHFHYDIFNDLSIHFFLACELQQQPPSFWQDCKKPVYKEDNVEIVLNTSMAKKIS